MPSRAAPGTSTPCATAWPSPPRASSTSAAACSTPPWSTGSWTGCPGGARMSEPTIYDVAREAGFSIKTVSRVLNGEDGVRPETVARVRAAIERLDYHPGPPPGARWRQAADGRPRRRLAQRPVLRRGHRRRRAPSRRDGDGRPRRLDRHGPPRNQSQIERLVRRGVAGLIVAPFGEGQAARGVLPDDVPVVVIDRSAESRTRTSSGSRTTTVPEAVRHLISHGHRRIAFLGETAEFTDRAGPAGGLLGRTGRGRITVDERLVETTCWDADAAYLLALALLAPPDAPHRRLRLHPARRARRPASPQAAGAPGYRPRRLRRLPPRRARDPTDNRGRPAPHRPGRGRVRPPRPPPRRPPRRRRRDRAADPPRAARVGRAAPREAP